MFFWTASPLLSWFTPSPTQPLAHSLTSGKGKESKRQKVKKKKVGWYKDSLKEKAKPTTQGKQNKELIHCSPRLEHKRCSAFSGQQGPIRHYSDLGRQTLALQMFSPFLLLSPTSFTQHDATWSVISLWSLGIACPNCVSSSQTRSFLARVAVQKAE